MDYNELYDRYVKLLEENKMLKEKNKNLREYIRLQVPNLFMDDKCKELTKTNTDTSIRGNKCIQVNKNSAPKDKIRLFMLLFKGREDVYAKRWQSENGKSGYSPVCVNEWVRGMCYKPKVKCSECKNKKYAPLNENAIDRHLRGIEVLGIYPMIKDETCYFVAIDFDDDGWENDISILQEICIEKKIPFAVERSRSGNGAHLWFFFKEKIAAASARKFATALLTYAMTKRYKIKFKSYDRLFPNQDTMPKGGLGNLIALPMQKFVRKNNNTVFVDKNFKPYEDQWKFLSSVEKLIRNQIECYISEICTNSELGDLKEDKEETDKPWKGNNEIRKLSIEDFPDNAHIIKANMLFISKEGFSNRALNSIKRIAAFKNPEFYKAQALRLSTFDKPRVISLSEETSEYLCIPRGCEMELNNFLKENKVGFEYNDNTYSGRIISVLFNGKLGEEQAVAGTMERKIETFFNNR